MLKVILVAGNPRYVKTELANAYYSEIVQFIESLGAEVCIDQTGPDFNDTLGLGDLYVVHGKQVDRLSELPQECIDCPVIKLGHPDGVIHPDDLEWQNNGSRGIPPDAHFIFTADQKLVIQQKVEELISMNTPAMVVQPRQSASRRPGVR